MRTRLTQKQGQFALNIFQGMTQREAWKQAGYSVNYPIAHIDRDASLLANSPKILQRLQELREKTESAAVMNVQERKERLTEIARARLTDFMELGQDGSWVNLGPEVPMSGAIQEIRSRTEYDKEGSSPTIYTSVKLHNPLQAIDLLNKMDKLYSEGSIFQDNRVARQVNIYVIDNETKNLLSQVGQRTKLIANGHTNNQSIQSDSPGMGRRQEAS